MLKIWKMHDGAKKYYKVYAKLYRRYKENWQESDNYAAMQLKWDKFEKLTTAAYHKYMVKGYFISIPPTNRHQGYINIKFKNYPKGFTNTIQRGSVKCR